MEKIKFRVWDFVNQRMCRVKRIEWNIDDDFVVWIEWDENGERKEEFRTSKQVVLMQYPDSEENGKEVYEGDKIVLVGWLAKMKKEE
jgi:hypothetical protein